MGLPIAITSPTRRDLYQPQASVFDRLESELAIGLYVEQHKLARRRLTGLLREAEMNMRLRDLIKAKEGGTPLPVVEMNKSAVIERKPMSITGIQSGAFQAKLAEMRQKIADKQTEALTKIDGAVASGAAKMHAAVDGVIAKADKEVDDALHEFAQFTNGGPA